MNRIWAANFKYQTIEDLPDPIFGGKTVSEITNMMMYAFLMEHIMSYTFGIFRTYELALRGESNDQGVESAPIETILRYIEITVDFIIFFWLIVHFIHMSKDQLNDTPFLSYWILIDSIIMFFTLPYVKLV